VHVAEHPPELRHHFDDMEQQQDSSTLGMWVFLLTEIMFFSGMFGAYTIYRNLYPEAFASTSKHMDAFYGGLNTAVLIVSSLTMALAVRSARVGHQRALRLFLILTIIFGLVFLGVKGFEYHAHWVDRTVPFWHWDPNYHGEPQFARQAQILFCFYFFMTGFHALHMIIGVVLMLVILTMAWRGRFRPDYYSPVEVSGLYWHFVDIVWIFLFPLLYLIGLSKH
jgi:cytochrome c oxidase subunit III